MSSATRSKLQINYNLSNAYICNNEYCFKNVFILVKISNKLSFELPSLLKYIILLSISKEFIHTFLEKKLNSNFLFLWKTKILQLFKKFKFQKLFLLKKKIFFLETEIIQANIEEPLFSTNDSTKDSKSPEIIWRLCLC